MLNQKPVGTFCIEVAPEPCVLVLFGGTGDLAKRKLFPSLFQLHCLGLLHHAARIVGCGRSGLTDAAFRDLAAGFLQQADPQERAAFLARVTYRQADIAEPSTFRDLAAYLDAMDQQTDAPVPLNRLYYLAVPPSSYQPIITLLDETGQIGEDDHDRGPWRHLLLEKPFGADTASACRLDAFLKTVAKEEQLFRIDHYLGKETIQNIMVMRFANIMFEPIWNAHYVDHVQITAAETIGVEQRAAYFDHTGLLRDMFQNHMIEMLALTAMEPPERFDADSIHARKLQLIRAIRPLDADDRSNAIVRAQYIAGQDMPAYCEEPGVAAGSTTETFVAAKLWIDTPRWSGTPFYLRSGKRMASNSSAINIVFKQSPHLDLGRPGSNALVLLSRPEEGMRLHLLA
ncbi:MAG: glucose-6-phosphate dehydrogenase, partial [Kiritimatiellae bacterium]|nr:glucose-6-phosphate dehydrogenase [Kiritimatiellia bacterium]